MENSFSLGCHQDVKNEQIDYVSDLMKNILGQIYEAKSFDYGV